MVPLFWSDSGVETVISRKVQLRKEDLELIEEVCSVLQYKSKSEYMRVAIQEKIRADKRKLREMKRQAAMAAYGQAGPEHVFESIEAEDFEDR
jgi:Arc/MetJ-type ribon-helix-helix transcriptional regulator